MTSGIAHRRNMSSNNRAIDFSVSSSLTRQTFIDLTASNQSVEPKKPTALPTFLPPCRVCNATASGYHYGANTCEACKAFFRRSLNPREAFRPCQYGDKCAENPKGKIACPDCRLKKCLSIGMTKAGIKKGRYTLSKRTENTKEANRIRADDNSRKTFDDQRCLEIPALLAVKFQQHLQPYLYYYTHAKEMKAMVNSLISNSDEFQGIKYSPGHVQSDEVIQWLTTVNGCVSVLRAAQTDYEGREAKKAFEDIMILGWADQLEKLLHRITGFAKSIPGFSDLDLNDRIILLKQGRSETMQVLRHPTIYVDLEHMAGGYSESGDLFVTSFFVIQSLMGSEFVRYMKATSTRLNKLSLNLEDTAVLIAFIMCTPDRIGLQRSDIVEKMQDSLLPVLQYTLKKNHPDNPNIISEILLIIPLLREHCETSLCVMRKLRYKLNQEKVPLIFEMLQE